MHRLFSWVDDEPTTPGTTNQCSNQLSYNHRLNESPNLGHLWVSLNLLWS